MTLKVQTDLFFLVWYSLYDNIIVAYGSETGTSLRYANIIAGVIGDSCIGKK